MSDDYSDFMSREPAKSVGTRFVERFKQQPFIITGWMGTFSALMYAAYRYKTKGPTISSSLFFVQLRVYAQGAIVGTLFLGMLYQGYVMQSKMKNEKAKD